MVMRALNSSHSAFFAFFLDLPYFEKYELQDGIERKFQVKIKVWKGKKAKFPLIPPPPQLGAPLLNPDVPANKMKVAEFCMKAIESTNDTENLKIFGEILKNALNWFFHKMWHNTV